MERTTSERIVDASRFFLTRGQVDPIQEREAAARKDEQARSTDAARRLERTSQVLEKLRESVRESIAKRETSPEEGNAFLNLLEQRYAEVNGINPQAVPTVNVSPEAPEFNTDFAKAFQDVDALEKAAVDAERAGNASRADMLMDRAESLRQSTVADLQKNPDVEFRDLGNRLGIFSKDGNLIKEIPKGTLRAPRQPSTKFVSLTLPDGSIKTLRADDPQIDALLEQGAVIPKGGSGGLAVEMGPDGRVTAIRTGDQATVGTKGQFERDLAKIDDVVLNAMDLSSKLREEDLGITGVLGEFFVDKLAAQFKPSLADPDRVKNRAFVRTLRESALRQVSGDSRFSNADREAINRILPEDGVFESLPSARGKLEMLAMVLRDRARIKAGIIDRKPVTAMSPVEIRDALERGEIDKVTAVRTLKYLHGSLSGN